MSQPQPRMILHEEFVTAGFIYTVIEMPDGRWEVQTSWRDQDKHRYTEFDTHAEAVAYCEKRVDDTAEGEQQ